MGIGFDDVIALVTWFTMALVTALFSVGCMAAKQPRWAVMFMALSLICTFGLLVGIWIY